ncbi:MAG TPA: AAA family ATPase [Ignavibacteria bacterium]|mgnify:CR=1 FL=1|nr:AAA family ATPase [Ignavibacteria bacterium]
MSKLKNKTIRIKRIIVEKLFGFYSYDLIVKNINDDLSRLMILYGDNGVGKTTILRLLFYLISTLDNSGYKSEIAKTKFKRFSVMFDNGVEITAERNSKDLIGTYTYGIRKRSKIVYAQTLKVQDDLTIRLDEKSKEYQVYNNILRYIKELNILVFYLSDERELLIGDLEKKDDGDYFDTETIITASGQKRKIRNESKHFLLENTVNKLNNWIRTQVLKASNLGSQNTNNIYLEIIKQIVQSKKGFKTLSVSKRSAEVINNLSKIEKVAAEYSKFGIISMFDFNELKKLIVNIPNYKLKIIFNILEPYIEGIQARLEALSSVQTVIYKFVSSVNTYFKDKVINYHLSSGFRIFDKENVKLDLNKLSSGEKQMLILFCNAITANDEGTIFIIDEPEISLNIKWQRELLMTLLNFSSDGKVQFILATHSIELLTPFRENVTRLFN